MSKKLSSIPPKYALIQDRSRSESLHNLPPEQLMNESDDDDDNSTFVPDEAALASEDDNSHYDDAASIRRDVDNFIPIEQDVHETNAPDAGVNEHHLKKDDTQQSNTEEDNIFDDNERSQDESDDENDRSQEETDEMPNEETAGVPTNNATITTTDEDTAGVIQNENAALQMGEENTLQTEINDRDIAVNIISPEDE
eukprot:8825476-Ditylum_brightwellii.AAC.1